MKLRSVSRGFFAAMLLALAANLAFLIVIRQAEAEVRVAFDARDNTNELVNQLVRENDLLAQLVQSYTTTGETHYLTDYYRILAGREDGPSAPQSKPAADSHSLIRRMQELDFSADELAFARSVLVAAARMQEIEKVAFAATQGLYDRASGEFVSDGRPDRAHAVALVHSADYERRRFALQLAVDELREHSLERTEGEVSRVRQQLAQAITAATVVDFALLPLLLLALWVLRQRVLLPISQLGEVAHQFTQGNLHVRTAVGGGRVQELGVLAKAMDDMAAALEADLARRNADQRELQAARDEAENATHAKSRFLANMSHEIRTPMNAIMGMTHLALQTELNAEQRDYLVKAQGASRMLLGLINDVLDFSKIEAGRMTVEAMPFKLEDVIAQAIEFVRQPAQAKELELVCDFADTSLLANRSHLRGDAMRLQQVLTNLLSNAVKFTPVGQVRLIIDTDRAAPNDDQVVLVLAVQDTGIGMSETQVAGLFHEFAQADLSTTRRYGGTGLGLAISHRLVELMGGNITATSQAGVGSRFVVKLGLPLEAVAPPPGCTAEAAASRVLVVDDQTDTRMTILGQLHTLGIGAHGRLSGACDAEQAMKALTAAAAAQEPFTQVLLDWVLPDQDGAEVLERIRSAHPDIRVAVISAYGTDEVRAEARRLGAYRFVTKPVLPEDLRRLFRADSPSAPMAEPVNNAALDGLRVLLVEDNALNRELAVELLRRRGALLELASNGLEALERLAARGASAFDVVLMDLQMPVLDGIEATRRLRADPAYDALPVFAMTAHALADERERCMAVGMQGHIAKPLDVSALVETLRTYAPHAAAEATPPAPHPVQRPFPDLPALDSARALHHFDGNETLYRNTLRAFVREHGEGVAAWQTWLDAGEWTELRRAAHTLRGLAGTIGASQLVDKARDLDDAAVRQDASAARSALPALAQCLSGLVAQIDAVLEPPPPWLNTGSPLPPDMAMTVDPQKGLDTMRELLKASDSRALDWWQTHHASLRAVLAPAEARRLSQAMNGLDFDAALAALPQEPA